MANLKQSRRRIMSNAENMKINLPEGYQRIEWIGSTGTQYIDTGLIPNQYSGFKCDFMPYNFVYSSGTDATAIFGEISDNQFALTTYCSDGNSHGSVILFTNTEQDACMADANARQLISYNVKNAQNQQYVAPRGTYSFSAESDESRSVYLFARNNTTPDLLGGGCRIYNFKWYNSFTLTANLIPCIRSLDEKPGMYDVVRQAFYTNAGTGEFTIPSN